VDISGLQAEVRADFGDSPFSDQEISRSNPAFIDYICPGDQDTFHRFFFFQVEISIQN
jgi:hypothetical protein